MNSAQPKVGDRESLIFSMKACANQLQEMCIGKGGLSEPFLFALDLQGKAIAFGIGDCIGPNGRQCVARIQSFLMASGIVRVFSFVESWVVARDKCAPDQPPPSECSDREELLLCVGQDIFHAPIACGYKFSRDNNSMISGFEPIESMQEGVLFTNFSFLPTAE